MNTDKILRTLITFFGLIVALQFYLLPALALSIAIILLGRGDVERKVRVLLTSTYLRNIHKIN